MTTPSTAAAPAHTPAQEARDALLNLASHDSPAPFLAQAPAYLAANPDDHPLRWLVGVMLARRGLRTLALETFAQLPASMLASPEIADDLAATQGLPDDTIPLGEMLLRLRSAADVLRSAGNTLPDFGDLERALTQHLINTRCFRVAHEPALIALSPAAGEPHATARTLGLGDSAESAAAYARAKIPHGEPFPHPCVLAGAESAPLLIEACRATRRDSTGYAPPVYYIEEDTARAAFVLASLGGLLSPATQPPSDFSPHRLSVHVGPGAMASFERHLRERLDWALPRTILATSDRDGLPARLNALLEHLADEQSAGLEALAAQIATAQAAADTTARHARLAGLATGGTPTTPARVLIITTRYTTFLRHSASDLAAALSDLGAHAEVFIEPDAGARVSTLAVARAVHRTNPDLVITFNYTRQVFGSLLPRTLPVACWVQDAMPHLFNPSTGAGLGPHDIIAGYLFPELFSRFGCDASRAVSLPVPACARKFSPSSPQRECELALVSHHAETPEAMHARLAREAGGAPPLARALGMLYPRVRDIASQAHALPPAQRLLKATQDALRSAMGCEPPAHVLSMVLHSYARPMADRFFRHEAIAWAASVCERRAWRLRLYGRGWEQHPGMARFAAGELPHGQALRDAYAGAAAHLHLSLMSLVHQRVVECGLSGGLVLARWHADALAGPRASALRALAHTPPDAQDHARVGFRTDTHEAAARFAALASHVGAPPQGSLLWVSREKFHAITSTPAPLAPHDDFDALTGDARRHVFRTRDELERLLTRAIDDPPWRDETIALARHAAAQGFTYDAAARALASATAGALGALATRHARAA